MSTRRILFVNHRVQNCGVYQYGRSISGLLALSLKLNVEYQEVSNIKELLDLSAAGDWCVVFVNYHPQTMPYINPMHARVFRAPCVAVMHEMTSQQASNMPRGVFQYYVMGDPTLTVSNGYVFGTGRLVPAFRPSGASPSIPTIGSVGFSVGSKGFWRVLNIVQETLDRAIVRIHLPVNGIIDPNGDLVSGVVADLRAQLWRPGVTLEFSHDFMTEFKLIKFLSENTANALLYDCLPTAGISSAADLALAARRPLAVTRSTMFRHLHCLKPSIAVEDRHLSAIIETGIAPYEHLLEEWAPGRLLTRYEEIVDEVGARQEWRDLPPPFGNSSRSAVLREEAKRTFVRVGRGLSRRTVNGLVKPVLQLARVATGEAMLATQMVPKRRRFNKTLNHWSRVSYQGTIKKLADLAPDVFARKIPDANVQQAFVLDSFLHFSKEYIAPRVLSVGGFDDTAAASIRRLGFSVDEVDPVINGLNLTMFCSLRPDVAGIYDIIFATSVLEHVYDDVLFMRQIDRLLAPGGVCIMTCDFKDDYEVGDPVIRPNFRFYTKKDLLDRVIPAAENCRLVDEPSWGRGEEDFALGGFRYSFAALVLRKVDDNVIDAPWSRMDIADTARFFREHGFLVIPGALSPSVVSRALAEVEATRMHGTTEEIWGSKGIVDIVCSPILLKTLRALLGEDLCFFKGAYVATPPCTPRKGLQQRKALHVDYGIGEPEGDLRNSSPSWINAAVYLTDLTRDHAPLWIVPGSNRCYHLTPGQDLEYLAPRARMVQAKAGDIVLFHCSTVHAASHNWSHDTRHAYFLSYRPRWAKPPGKVREWSGDIVSRFSYENRAMLLGMNDGSIGAESCGEE